MHSRRFRLARRLIMLGVLLGLSAAPHPAAADVGSDHPAAILVFPKLLVDTTNGLDTLVRITNVSDQPLNVACFYVNTTPQCLAADGTSCFPNKQFCVENVGGQLVGAGCQPQWNETDFTFQLTQDQPTGWLVSGGEGTNCAFLDGVCASDGTTRCDRDADCGAHDRCVRPPCFPLDGILGRVGPNKQLNQGTVPISPQDPFIGELKCIAVDNTGTDTPIARNDLIGEALIGRVQPGPDQILMAGYNAIGIPAEIDNPCQPGGTCLNGGTCQTDSDCEQTTNNRDKVLVLGGAAGTEPPAEYEGCPNVLILDAFFDGAVDPLITNSCQPNGTCSISKTACVADADCVDNICLAGGTCSVTGTACASPSDCLNTCVTTNQCVGNTCSVDAAPCTGTSDCANNVCSLSKQKCLHDDDCTDPGFRARIGTDLTLVPCTEDFENQNPQLSQTTAQFLIFNEFENRFSLSTTVQCFKEARLSSLDSGNQNDRSLLSVGVEGTLTGQIRIRGVQSADPTQAGNGLLGVVEEFRCGGPEFQFPLCSFTETPAAVVSATAKNLHFQGLRPVSDFIYLPGQ